MTESNMGQNYDLVVVGSGWFGLGAARAYIEAHPNEKIAILESNPTVGGTWSRDRLYPGLKSNNMVGSYEFPDYPMSEDKYGVRPGEHIPGGVLHRYLTDFAREYGVLERLQFNTAVEKAELTPKDDWVLKVTGPDGPRQLCTKKLILATGLTSTPNIPSYAGIENFGKPFFHAKDFCRRAKELEGSKNVIVVGGAKSAYDVAYAMVEKGATVDLIIRPESHGPVWIAPRYVTPTKQRVDTILNVRYMSWFSPCPWGDEDGYGRIRRFIQGTAIGRVLVRAFWKLLGNDVLSAHKYDSHPELAKLKPWQSVFWIGSGLSIYNYNTPLFDMVKDGRIRVHVENVDHIEAGKVKLCNGRVLEADGMVCSTGWKKESSIQLSGLPKAGLGLPFQEQEMKWLNTEADSKLLRMFPVLKDQPKLRFKPAPADPLRYYRFMVPPTFLSRRNLAFAGMISSVSTAMCATMQGAWISSFMDGKLEREVKTQEDVTKEIMMHTNWGKWRYPCGYGASLPDLVFEGLPYCDMLLKDIGLKTHRKPSLYKELTEPYTPADYRGVIGEWAHKLDASKDLVK